LLLLFLREEAGTPRLRLDIHLSPCSPEAT
jgi:hypothetical protein